VTQLFSHVLPLIFLSPPFATKKTSYTSDNHRLVSLYSHKKLAQAFGSS
jgi:hypothetical protein